MLANVFIREAKQRPTGAAKCGGMGQKHEAFRNKGHHIYRLNEVSEELAVSQLS